MGQKGEKPEGGRKKNEEKKSNRKYRSQEKQEGPIRRQRFHLRRPLMANKPSGRHCRNAMIISSTMTLAATAPQSGSIKTLTCPIPSAATTVPAMVPTPPSTT